MIYEIINPSDAYTMRSDSPAAAALACLLVGNGKYGLTDEAGASACEIFLFGGDPQSWFRDQFGCTIESFLDEHFCDVVSALRSIMIGGVAARIECEDAISRMGEDDARAFLLARHDRKRSSMNDIGSRALSIADKIELKHQHAKAEAAMKGTT